MVPYASTSGVLVWVGPTVVAGVSVAVEVLGVVGVCVAGCVVSVAVAGAVGVVVTKTMPFVAAAVAKPGSIGVP